MFRWMPLLAIALATVGKPGDLTGQDLSTRFGFGGGGVLNPSNSEISKDDLGIDLRGRISQPIGARASIAADVGVFLFNAAEHTEIVLNPQVSLIVTLGGDKRFPYIMVGAGALFPTEQDADGQLTVHAGYGWAWPMGRVSIFAELDPMIAFREEGVAAVIPIRAGLIF